MPPDGHQAAKLLSIADSLNPELHQSTKHPVQSIIVELREPKEGLSPAVDRLVQKEDNRPMDRLLAEEDEVIVDLRGRECRSIHGLIQRATERRGKAVLIFR
jgi:hypothetical protein